MARLEVASVPCALPVVVAAEEAARISESAAAASPDAELPAAAASAVEESEPAAEFAVEASAQRAA